MNIITLWLVNILKISRNMEVIKIIEFKKYYAKYLHKILIMKIPWILLWGNQNYKSKRINSKI